MKILVTGGCGFVGSNLSIFLKSKGFKIYSLDNLCRRGSILNQKRLSKLNIKNFKIDIFNSKHINKLDKFDLIIDCCAEPSVEASRKSFTEARRVFNTNLVGTFNIIQKCLKDNSKIIFLSSSRVYSIKKINSLFKNKINKSNQKIDNPINLNFDKSSPKTLYGLTKLFSEDLIKEFSYSNGIKYLINRCGVIAGPWQMGKVDQGFVSLFIWRYLNKKPLTFIGYKGKGNQIRDILHCNDLNELIYKQIKQFNKVYNKTFTVGGGKQNAISLYGFSELLKKKTKNIIPIKKKLKTSIYDIPYFVTSNKEVSKTYNWKPKNNIKNIISDVYDWQKKNYKNLNKILK